MQCYKTSTFSIVGYDPATGRTGAATASCVLGVGGRLMFYRSDGTIVLMQHIEYPPLAERVVAEIQAGRYPKEALECMLQADPEAQQRQMLAVSRSGQIGVHSGGECSAICAQAAGESVAAAGNCLSAETIPAQMLDAYKACPDQPLSIRLLRALARAAELKGDQRGLQSAALISIPRQLDSWKAQIVNLRADHHEDPVGELGRLYDVFTSRFGAQ